MKQRIVVSRAIQEAGLRFLEDDFAVEVLDEGTPRPVLLEKLKGAVGFISMLSDKIDEELLDAAPSLKGVANYAVGFDNMDLKAATQRGIPLSNTPDVLTLATAEMAWALLFAAARRVVESDRLVRNGKWKGWGPLQFIGADISGKTLGVIGSGRIGTAFAQMSAGFRMKVLYRGNRPNPFLEEQLGARRVDQEEILAESDFLSLHIPLKPETEHMIDTEALKLMKESAVLINTARGAVIDETALVEALKTGEIAAAGLDVYESEPRVTEELKRLDNVVLTPHTGSATEKARQEMGLMAAENLKAMIAGEEAPQCINPEVYSK